MPLTLDSSARTPGDCTEHAGFLREAGQPAMMLHLTLPNAVGGAPRRGVVFCHPLSTEKQYSARSFVLMARSFAAAGVPCVRHDSVGTGDSEGTSVDLRVEGLVRDALRAAAVLRQQTGVTELVFIGILLGAAVARMAAARHADGKSAAVLIDPVTDGKAWWQQLLKQQQMSFMTRGQPVPKLETLAAGDAGGLVEIKAEHYHPDFIAGLAALDAASVSSGHLGPLLQVRYVAQTAAVATPADPGAWEEAGPNFWNDKSLYAGQWPEPLAVRLLDWIRGLDA